MKRRKIGPCSARGTGGRYHRRCERECRRKDLADCILNRLFQLGRVLGLEKTPTAGDSNVLEFLDRSGVFVGLRQSKSDDVNDNVLRTGESARMI